MIGSVDSGKTTITGVLVNNIMDDGRGGARSTILRHPHEKESGRTSSITQNYLKLENKVIDFVDLAGHEKYLKTTISGLKRCLIDYTAIVVGANMGVLHMTREHIGLAMALNLPMFIILTKVDIAPDNVRENTIINIHKIIKKYSKKREPRLVSSIKDIELGQNIDKLYDVPIFPISSVSGIGLDNLKKYIFGLNSYSSYHELCDNDANFIIDCKYQIKGIGVVVSGVMNSGTINKGDSIYLGPINNKFVKVIIKSIHDNFKTNVNTLYAGQGGCFNIKPSTSKDTFKKNKIQKGMVLANNPILYSKFDADIKIIQHPTTIKVNYEPVIHSKNIIQTARIMEIKNQNYLRVGDKACVSFKFCYNAECVEVGSDIIFREGRTKGIGKITKVYN